jgi:hypothetical protein
MPTVLISKGYRFKFYSNENNEPPHVHVIKGTAEAKWWLDTELEEEYSMGFKVQELRTVRTLLKQHRDELLEAWEKHFSA